MFVNVGNVVVLTIFILSLSGCFGGHSVDVGMEVSEIVYLDDEHDAELFVGRG